MMEILKWLYQFTSGQRQTHHPQPKTRGCGSDTFFCIWTGRYLLRRLDWMQRRFTKKSSKKSPTHSLRSARSGFRVRCTTSDKATSTKLAKHLDLQSVRHRDPVFLRPTLTWNSNLSKSIDAERSRRSFWRRSRIRLKPGPVTPSSRRLWTRQSERAQFTNLRCNKKTWRCLSWSGRPSSSLK